jgi:hypothetical protein
LWVEDLERFAGINLSPRIVPGDAKDVIDEKLPQEEKRIGPLQALFYQIDRLSAFSVITATTTLQLRFDLDKIAQYVEEIPAIEECDAAQILGAFRNGCLSIRKFIQPSLADRNSLENLGNAEAWNIARMIRGGNILTIGDALPLFCKTPRTLKKALRRCLEMWKNFDLCGEIDFDDILVMNLVKESDPQRFELIRQWIESGNLMRTAEREKRGSWVHSSTFTFRKDDRYDMAFEQVVKFICDEENRRKKPQGLIHDKYWKRFQSPFLLNEQQCDQVILRVLTAGSDSEFLKLICDPMRSSEIDLYPEVTETRRLVRLLTPLVEFYEEVMPQRKHGGLHVLYRLISRRVDRTDWDQSVLFMELESALSAVVPKNLFLALEIERLFVDAEGDTDMLAGPPEITDVLERQRAMDATMRRSELRTRLRDLFLEHYGTPGELIAASTNADPNLLSRLCFCAKESKTQATDYEPFKGWGQLANIVLEAARSDPRTMLPQIARLITTSSGTLKQPEVQLVPDRAKKLFGDDQKVLALYLQQNAFDWPDDPAVTKLIHTSQKEMK